MNRKPLYIAAGIIAGLMLLIILISWLLGRNGQLVIVAPQGTPVTVNVISKDRSFNRSFQVDAGAKNQLDVKPGVYQVSSTASLEKTIDVVRVDENKTTTVNVSFGTAKATSIIALGIDNCPAVINNAVYDYECEGADFVYRMNDNFDGTKAILFDSQRFDYLTAYKSGFLGFPVESSLQYADVTNQSLQGVALPAALGEAEIRDTLLIATTHDPRKSYFALHLPGTDKIFLYNDVGDTEPKELTLPKGYLQQDGYMASLNFTRDRLVVYLGYVSEEELNEGETVLQEEEHEIKEGKLLEFTLEGKNTRTITTPKDFIADQVFKLSDTFYAADRIDGAEFFYMNNGKLEGVHTVAEVADVVPVDDKLYIQTDNRISVFTPGEEGAFSLKSIYAPQNANLNNIFAGPGYLIFTATGEGQSVATAYRFTDN